MDLSKLPAAPWIVFGPWSYIGRPGTVDHPMLIAEEDDHEGDIAALDFAALARNAFDGDHEALAWWEANRRRR